MINKRKSSDEKDEMRDLLSNLVDANEEFLDDGEKRLGEEELIGESPRICPGPVGLHTYCLGNVFMFYIAGHEVR